MVSIGRRLMDLGFQSTPKLFWLVAALMIPLCGMPRAMAQAPAEAGDAEELVQPVNSVAFRLEVELPLSGDSDERLIRQIRSILDTPRPNQGRPIIILEFRGPRNPAPGQVVFDPNRGALPIGRGTRFERALSLARFLVSSESSRAKIVAFTERPIEGHAVLPLIACEEILVTSGSGIGNATIDEDKVDGTIRGAYEEIAKNRKTIPTAAVMAMVDKSVVLYEMVTLEGGVRFVTNTEREELLKDGNAWEETRISNPGQLASFPAEKMRGYRWVNRVLQGREELIVALSLSAPPIDSIKPIGPPRAVLVRFGNQISLRQVATIIRQLRGELDKGANVIVVEVDSDGGSIEASLQMAQFLTGLDPTQAQTVAWLTGNARGDAAWIVMSCRNRYAIQDVQLGGPGEATLGTRQLEDVNKSLQDLGRRIGFSGSLLAALASPNASVSRYVNTLDGRTEWMNESDLRLLPDGKSWEKKEELDLREGLKFEEARKLGLLQANANQEQDLQEKLALDSPIERVRSTWLEDTVATLAANNSLKFLLIFVAIMTLSTELSTPGIGVPGFISAVCFGSFFWLQFCNGTLAWLEVFLFIGGVIFLAMELFVLPGFGVFGFGGLVMLISSIVLASQTFVLPTNSYQFDRFSWNLLGVAILCLCVMVGFVILRRNFETLPMFRHLALRPAGTDDVRQLEQRESVADFSYLADKAGVTTTRLNPSGKVLFGNDLVSVLSDGSLIDEGTQVRVLEIRGNTIVVEPLNPS